LPFLIRTASILLACRQDGGVTLRTASILLACRQDGGGTTVTHCFIPQKGL
jgi:hypothetical protein